MSKVKEFASHQGVDLSKIITPATTNNTGTDDLTDYVSVTELANVATRNTKQELLENLKESKKSLIEDITRIDKIVDLVDNLAYSKGDIVYHKEYGACIVQQVHLGGYGVYGSTTDFEILVKVGHSNGTDEVTSNTLVLQTDMTRAIYE